MTEDVRLDHAEKMVIGGCVQQPGLALGLELAPGDFRHPGAVSLWRGMQRLSEDGKVWSDAHDLAGRIAETASDRDNLLRYLEDPIVAAIASPADVPDHADVVKTASVTRQAIAVGAAAEALAVKGYLGAELVAELQQRLANLGASASRLRSRTLRELAEMAAERVLNPEAEGTGSCVPVGLERIDSQIGGGWQGGLLHVLCAKTSHGKSAAILQFALNAARLLPGKRPAHVVSTEDLEADTGWRGLAWVTGIPAFTLRMYHSLPDYERERVAAAKPRLAALDRVRITPASGMTARQVIATVRQYEREDETGIVFVDYLQALEQSPGEKENDTWTRYMNAFDLAAKTDGVPWVIASQVRRTEGDEFELKHLRGSGAIENRGKIIIAMHRPNFGKEDGDDWMRMRILKNSHGPLSAGDFTWNGPLMEISNGKPASAYATPAPAERKRSRWNGYSNDD